ncbi:unnamed protein product, partial [Didymodactylos carnosus]
MPPPSIPSQQPIRSITIPLRRIALPISLTHSSKSSQQPSKRTVVPVELGNNPVTNQPLSHDDPVYTTLSSPRRKRARELPSNRHPLVTTTSTIKHRVFSKGKYPPKPVSPAQEPIFPSPPSILTSINSSFPTPSTVVDTSSLKKYKADLSHIFGQHNTNIPTPLVLANTRGHPVVRTSTPSTLTTAIVTPLPHTSKSTITYTMRSPQEHVPIELDDDPIILTVHAPTRNIDDDEIDEAPSPISNDKPIILAVYAP